MNIKAMRKYFEEQNGVAPDAVFIDGEYRWSSHPNAAHNPQQDLWEAFQDGVEYGRGNVPKGYKLVPIQPTEEQWGGLARDLIMWMDMAQRPTGKSLYQHLWRCGREVPQWLKDEVEDVDHVPPKGTRAAIIYKAMLHDL